MRWHMSISRPLNMDQDTFVGVVMGYRRRDDAVAIL